jgi:hypothetical protein
MLRELSAAGGGRLELARDARQLAATLRREVAAARGPLIREGRAAVAASPHPVIGDAEAGRIPPVLGYVATTPRPPATVVLRTETGDPLLALGPFGLGRVAALLTDLEGRWGVEWRRWDGTPRLMANTVRWLLRAPGDEQIVIRQERTRSGWEIAIQAADLDGGYLNGRRLVAHLHAEEGGATRLALEPRGPGRYAGVLDSRIAKPTLVVLEDRTDGEERILARSHLGLSYPDEYRLRGPNRDLLEEICRVTGGHWLGAAGRALAPRHTAPREVPLWPWLSWVGLGLFLLEVIVGRSGQSERIVAVSAGKGARFGAAWAVGKWRGAVRAVGESRRRACDRP